MFFGTFTHSLDDAGRLTIPARIREAVAGSGDADRLVLTCGAEPCIVVYPQSRVAEIMASMKSGAIKPAEAREFKRIFGGEGAMESWDRQGRILLAEALRLHAGITREVVIVGAVDCFEIWDAERYRQHHDRAKSAYENVAGKIIQ